MVVRGRQKQVLAMLFSRISSLSAQKRLPDNLTTSIAPVSRGQIGLAAASYVLAVQEYIPQHGRYGEPNIVTSAP